MQTQSWVAAMAARRQPNTARSRTPTSRAWWTQPLTFIETLQRLAAAQITLDKTALYRAAAHELTSPRLPYAVMHARGTKHPKKNCPYCRAGIACPAHPVG